MEEDKTMPRRHQALLSGMIGNGRRAIRVAATLLVLLLASTTTAYGVTLGQARVISYLNQPLEAEIELVGLAPGQHEDLRIRIANQAQFDRLGISYTLFLSDLKFDVVQSSGRWIVRVRSRKPVTEPFLDFPVQMTWPGGQMIRQYTLLLDPLTLSRPATVTRTAAPAPRAAPAASQPRQAGGAVYGPVQSGETLWPIAQKLKPGGITTQQMAIALLRANPQAFINGNINALRAGAVLDVPPLGVIQQLDAGAARREFAEQTRQWRAAVSTSPREVVAAPPTGTPPAQADEATARPSETPSEPPADAAPAEETDAQLRIVGDQPKEPAQDDDTIQQQLLVTMEEIESNRITTTAIESRLAKLEEELSKMQALVDLKDQQIAALQSELAARDGSPAADATVTAPPPETSTVTEPVQPPAAVAPAPAEPAPVDAPVTVEAPPLPAAEPPRTTWYEQYQWLIWALLGVIGLVAVAVMIRRQLSDQARSNVPMADLPSAMPATYATAAEPAFGATKQAERDFEDFARGQVSEIEPAAPAEEPQPKFDRSQADVADGPMKGVGSSVLDELLDSEKQLDQRPAPAVADMDDQDIAKWVEELGAEIDQLDMVATPDDRDKSKARTEKARTEDELDGDIPSILNELDDQLGATDAIDDRASGPVKLEPLDEPEQLDALADLPTPEPAGSNAEDDTFTMSLDLARAYLEIGDSDGARDMLKQALSGARDPDQRRQIEELLRQVD
jgi:FimV-like protein